MRVASSAAALCAALAACRVPHSSVTPILELPTPPADARLHYATLPQQFGALRLPKSLEYRRIGDAAGGWPNTGADLPEPQRLLMFDPP